MSRYLPPVVPNEPLCDPWGAVSYRTAVEELTDEVGVSANADLGTNSYSVRCFQCNYCLPDCNGTIYSQTVTAVPYRRCDSKNLGVSYFCNIDDASLPSPPIFGAQVCP